ncbi:MAG TPA: hypothetical protein PLH23_04905 [Hyphomonadaceae bacterium]|nr:hypothetical protein [Hyphomonadaceae bacterium]HPI47585.1 hypothetical protein [Hyphomonadaceae bacterium]
MPKLPKPRDPSVPLNLDGKPGEPVLRLRDGVVAHTEQADETADGNDAAVETGSVAADQPASAPRVPDSRISYAKKPRRNSAPLIILGIWALVLVIAAMARTLAKTG